MFCIKYYPLCVIFILYYILYFYIVIFELTEKKYFLNQLRNKQYLTLLLKF